MTALFERAWTNGVITTFVVLILLIMVASVVAVVAYSVRGAGAIRAAHSLLDGVTRENLASMGGTLKRRAQVLEERPGSEGHDHGTQPKRRRVGQSRTGELWIEFDETLVQKDQRLHNTEPASHHFSGDHFAPQLFHNRLLHSAPATLTALGLLGTFVGLAIGLSGLNFSANASVEDIRAGLGPLIDGASVGFISSMVGIAMSLLVIVITRGAEAYIGTRADSFSRRIDGLFVHQSSEQSLVRIEEHTHNGSAALEELHEKIGTSLQEAVRGLSDDMQNAVSRAINSSLRPAMDQIAEHSINQTTEVFSQLVERFAASFESIGDRQAAQMDAASDSLNASVANLTGTLDATIEQVRETIAEQQRVHEQHVRDFREQLTDLTTLAEKITDRLEDAALRLDSGAASLREAGDSLAGGANALVETRAALESALTEVAGALEGTGTAHAEAAALLDRHTSELLRLHNSSQALSTSITQAAENVNRGFAGLADQQRNFLDGLEERVGHLDAAMDDHMANFAEKVHQQTTERMEEWNKHSRDFAGHMLTTSERLSAVIDELEVKSNGTGPSS